jgi:hypothetical protein
MDGLEYFLTYADNNAVGYFSKQAFTKTVSLEKDKVRLRGLGGARMKCVFLLRVRRPSGGPRSSPVTAVGGSHTAARQSLAQRQGAWGRLGGHHACALSCKPN